VRKIDKENSRMTKKRLSLIYLAWISITSLNFSSILRSSWTGDDWPNSQTPYWILWRSGNLDPKSVLQEALFWHNAWAEGQGRFYLFHWIESRFIFSYLREAWQYKTFQFLTLILAIFLFTLLVQLISKSIYVSLTTLIFLNLTVQFRRDFDPHIAFAAMLPTLLIKVFGASILCYISASIINKWKALILAFLASAIYFTAMATYEFSFLLFPILLLCFSIGRNHKFRLNNKLNVIQLIKNTFLTQFVLIFISWVGYAYLVFGYLRPKATNISGSYVLSIGVDSIKVFLSQLFVGLPTIALRRVDFNQLGNYVFAPTLVLISALIILRYLVRNLPKLTSENSITEKEPRIYLYLISICLISSPGFIMSLQPTWWNRASLFNSYLGVMICEFGTALLIALIVGRNLEVFSNQLKSDSRQAKFIRGKKELINKNNKKIFAGQSVMKMNQRVWLICVLIFLNASHNILVAEENKGRNFQYNAWEALTKQKNIFEGVKNRDIFISNNQDDSFETNAGKFYYNSGIRLSYLFKTNIIYPENISCVSESECDLLPVKEIAIKKLDNLVRTGANLVRADDMKNTWSNLENKTIDWVESNRAPGVLQNSKVWAFDMFLISQSTYISYLVPFIGDRKIPTVDSNYFKIFTVENSEKPLLSPAVNNICFSLKEQFLANNGLVVKVWEVPRSTINNGIELSKEIEFSKIGVGLCA